MKLFTALLLLMSGSLLFAEHKHTAPHIVDGAVHPELIPDSVAYRLYFLVVSEKPNPPAEAQRRQLAHLRMLRLDNEDLQILITELEDFKVHYTQMIDRYNAEAAAALANGSQTDQETFLAQRDSLVDATRERLRNRLSPDGLKRVDMYVQNEKRHMSLTMEEGQ
jgi:hypothetical protein